MSAETVERVPGVRFGRDLPFDAPPCGAVHESGVTCVKPKGHDEPYYVEYDHGQWSEYSDEPHEPFDFEARHRFEWAAEVSKEETPFVRYWTKDRHAQVVEPVDGEL